VRRRRRRQAGFLVELGWRAQEDLNPRPSDP
jgi:hypothetical protein